MAGQTGQSQEIHSREVWRRVVCDLDQTGLALDRRLRDCDLVLGPHSVDRETSYHSRNRTPGLRRFFANELNSGVFQRYDIARRAAREAG